MNVDMDEARKALARKVGPLPVGAWLAVVAVGVAATAAIIRHRRAANVAPMTAADLPTSVGLGSRCAVTRTLPRASDSAAFMK